MQSRVLHRVSKKPDNFQIDVCSKLTVQQQIFSTEKLCFSPTKYNVLWEKEVQRLRTVRYLSNHHFSKVQVKPDFSRFYINNIGLL